MVTRVISRVKKTIPTFREFMASLLAFFLIYVIIILVRQGWATYLLTMPPAIVVLITAWVRLDDIDRHLSGFFWHMRRMGLTFIGTTAAMVLSGPFTYTAYFPTKFMMIGMWGLAFCWITTPGLIPWWKLVTKYQPLSTQFVDPPTSQPPSP